MMKQDAIVLLHGFNHDHRCWKYVIDELHAMAPEVPVYAVDLPGRGDKKWKTVWTPKQSAKAMMKDIDKLELDRVFLVGHSLAGHTLPLVSGKLGDERLLGQMYIAATCPPEGKSFFTTIIPFRPLSLFIQLGGLTNIPLKMPKPAREYLWCCKSTPKEKRDIMHSVVVWERVSLFAYPVTREGMLHKNVFWVRTLQDRSCPQRLQSFYRDNLGVDEELYIDAPHDCMITHPHELAELILQSYRKCLNR